MNGTHTARGRASYPWHLPFEEAVRHLRPGDWDVRVLDQDRLWVDSAAVVRPLAALDDLHLVNIATMLRREALRLVVEHEAITDPAGTSRARFMKALGTARAVVPLWQAAVDWLQHTMFWAGLQAELDHRGMTGPTVFARIDQQNGVWAVRTRDRVQVLDLDQHRTIRLPVPEAARSRSRAQWARLDALGPVQVGRSMRMAVLNRSGTATNRTLGPVTGIRQLPTGLSDDDLLEHARDAWPAETSVWDLTEYRTEAFVTAAAVVCDYWAGLTLILTEAGVSRPVLLVPYRLREPTADPGAVELCLTGPMPEDGVTLQMRVDEVVGFHLPVAHVSVYDQVGVAAHAIPFAPGP